jgi:PIN domain nuclease of toxin-antitoxin system
VGVKHLVDTHVLLWLLSAPDRIAEPVRDALADRSNPLLVSAASALEITTKTRLGKLDAAGLVTTLGRRLEDISADVLSITFEHALLAGSMSWPHRDPFDRLLLAQATIEDAILVTVDAAITDLPFPRILTW